MGAAEDSGRREQGRGYLWPAWYARLAGYRGADNRRALGQLANTLLPYFLLCFLMLQSLRHGFPYLLTLCLAIPAAALLVRIFILFHDCVHGSFFTAKWANTVCGYLCGVLVFTSLEHWRFSHLRHHATYANLDTRGFGDIWTLTLAEYRNASPFGRLRYRLYRTPLVLFALGAFFTFFLAHRLPNRKMRRIEHMSILFTNLLLVVVALGFAKLVGWRNYLLVQLPVLWLAGVAGIWLFYVQHQFVGVYWARRENWDPLRAALQGSSWYRLPALLRWLSGNIGFHHVHHLGPRIPNYRLRECCEAIPELQAKTALTLRQSLGCVRLKLWDEEHQELVPFP